MKKILLVAVLFLAGCSVILPKPHDPVMLDRIVGIDIQSWKVNCEQKDDRWDTLFTQVHHLKVYTELRDDPQSKSIAQLEEALIKAYNTKNKSFCVSILNLQRTRIKVAEDAWKGR